MVGGPAREEFGLDAARCHLGGDVALHHAVGFARDLRDFGPDALIVGTFRKLLLAGLAGRLAGVRPVVARIGLSTDTPRSAKYRFVLRRWVHRIVVNDDELRAAYRTALPDVPDDRLHTVYKGVRAPEPTGEAGALRREAGIPAGARIVGTLARLADQKRLDRLIRTTARLPDDVHCLIAGEGPERESLEELVGALDVGERVHFLGFRDDVGDVLAALDLLVLTSEREALANAMLEALAAGVPVVSTPVSGATEALEPLADGSEPGLIVDPDPAALVDAVGALLDDPDRRERMAEAARRRARERFSVEAMLDAWEAVVDGRNPAAAGTV